MAKTVERLSAVGISREKTPGKYPDGAGLYLQVSPKGSKSWILRYRPPGHLSSNGRPLSREMGLGRFPDVSLAEARDRARDERKKVSKGVDPIGNKANEVPVAAVIPKSITFSQAAKRYIAAHRPSWKSHVHASQWEYTLLVLAESIGELDVRTIDIDEVYGVLAPIWTAKPETAGRLRGRIECVLDWCIVQKFRDGPNPAVWRGGLKLLLPKKSSIRKVRHHPSMPYPQVPDLVTRLRSEQGVAAIAMEFLIRTAARTSEVICGTTTEIDRAKMVWTVPSERMKMGREHRVPLSPRMIELIDRLAPLREAKGVSWLFPSPQEGKAALSSAGMDALLERMKLKHFTVHGFRSSFRTWGGEKTSYPSEILETCLAHVNGDRVEAAYLRTDFLEQRRQVMDDWSAWLDGGANVNRQAAE